MQHRMKEFSMTPEATFALLGRGQVGVLSTSGADGAPYGVPVHYLWQDGKLWFHGLPAGEKLENIARDHRVCFTVWEFGGILTEGAENPCQADAARLGGRMVGCLGRGRNRGRLFFQKLICHRVTPLLPIRPKPGVCPGVPQGGRSALLLADQPAHLLVEGQVFTHALLRVSSVSLARIEFLPFRLNLLRGELGPAIRLVLVAQV